MNVGGREPLVLSNGEQRNFRANGDCLILRGRYSRPGARRIGFGEGRGMVLPAYQVWQPRQEMQAPRRPG
jgi:fumarylacetoacetase